jgi:hypothetical protein
LAAKKFEQQKRITANQRDDRKRKEELEPLDFSSAAIAEDKELSSIINQMRKRNRN